MPAPHWPPTGAVRVAAEPAALPTHRRPVNRFDDPQCQFLVRYLADTLRGSLVELLARFRFDTEAEDRIAKVTGVDTAEGDGAYVAAAALGDWLARQRVATCSLATPRRAVLLFVNDARLLAELNHHPRVRAALDAADLAPGPQAGRAELDGATIRLPGSRGRAITQAVSRVLYERDPRPAALAYRSRLDDEEMCWAVYDHTPTVFTAAARLDPAVSDHLNAVRAAAALYGLQLPAPWASP